MKEQYLLLYKAKDASDWLPFPFSDWVKVGNNPKNNLVITDGELSGFHFELRENPTGIYLKDVDVESGETVLMGESIRANQPTPVNLQQVFAAGNYEFKIALNLGEDVDTPEPIVSQARTAIKSFGIGKTVGIGLAVALIAVVGAVLLYNALIKKPEQTIETAATQSVDTVVEMVSTLVPTELFELSSTVVVEAVDALVTAPGMGDFQLQELLVDVSTMNVSNLMEFAMDPSQLVNMATTITGDNVGFVYAYSAMKVDGRIITTGLQFVESPQEEVVDGVQMPDWSESEIPVEILWQPVLTLLDDGNTQSLALLLPTIYGAAEDDQVYTVQGIYQQETSADQFSALARFAADGTMIDILTFGLVDSERQTPYKVNFKAGDSFTPYELEFIHDPQATEDLALDLTGDSLPMGWSKLLQYLISGSGDGSYQFGIGKYEKHIGTALTLNEAGLNWVRNESPDGEFFAGVAIEDLDGNLFVGYIPVLVQP